MIQHSDPDARRAREHAKSRHHFTDKSVAKLPKNPRILKTLLKAHFQQFMTKFGDCSISKTIFKKKKSIKIVLKLKHNGEVENYDVIIFEK